MSLCEIFCSIVESRTSSPHSRGENGREGGALSLHCGTPTPQLMERGEGRKGGKGRFVILWRREVEGTQGDKRFDRSFKRQNIAEMKLLKSVRSKQIQCAFSLVKKKCTLMANFSWLVWSDGCSQACEMRPPPRSLERPPRPPPLFGGFH